MKTALFLFLSLIALPGFSQSKKAMNKILLEKNAQLVQKNDSLTQVIIRNQNKIKDLSTSSYQEGSNLLDRRQKFLRLKKDIANVQKMLLELNFNSNTLVNQEELDAVYAAYQDTEYRKEIKQELAVYRPIFKINKLEDISTEKLKVQNERLAQKNQEYITAIDSNLSTIRNEEVLISKFNNLIPKMQEANLVLIKNNRLLDEKYKLLRLKYVELELKKEQAELAAENAEKESVVKTPSKKKKERTMDFVPPVITDVEYTPSLKEFSENAGFESDVAPPPPPSVREERTSKEPEIFDVVEEPASFPGGREALLKYLSDNIVYPQVAKDAGLAGKVYLKFVVSEKGNISNVKVMRGVPDCKECDQEAIRVVKKMPNWIPGKNNGKAVNTYYNLPIGFKL